MPREFYLLLCVACARAECYGSRLRPANLINLDVIPSLSKGSYESLQLACRQLHYHEKTLVQVRKKSLLLVLHVTAKAAR